ncbi:MAG TPA: lysophospholipid acyltransferase family protein [Phycisphaerae bacterium]|nr:lysophospholipid acyltransferase family protein [Phycisphaerae bacterium]
MTAPTNPSLPSKPVTAPSPPPSPDAPAYVFRGEGHGPLQRLAWNTGRLISRILSILLFRLHVSGQSNIPKTGGVLMVSNHQSFLDPWLIGIAPSRQVHYMARDTLFKGGFLHWLMELLNAFPVKRGAADLTAIRTAVERLDKGFLLNIFPEGTRSEDGSIGHIAPGVSLILNRCKSDITIVPVCIDGAFEAWPRTSRFPHPHAIRIRHGAPIAAAEWRQLSPDALAVRLRSDLVRLQAAMNSAHAARSQQRLAEALAAPAGGGSARRRR